LKLISSSEGDRKFMQMRELINTINDYNAKIIFYDKTDLVDKLKEGLSIYFTPVEGKELKKYMNIKGKKDFISTTASIHIPDLSIEEFVDIFKCYGMGLYEFTNNIIKPYCNNGIDNNIVFSTFVFLHEVGHWNQFKSMGRNVSTFESRDYELSKENFNKMKSLIEEYNERIAKGNTCILTAKEKKLSNQYMTEYRNIPKEKEADEFALSQIESALKLYLQFSVKI
jgi:hypothetical protein